MRPSTGYNSCTHNPDPVHHDRPASPLAEELMHQGHQVFEAVAISEVYAMADQHLNATFINTAEVHPKRAKAVQYHYTTLHLKPEATARDIVWELSHVMKGATVQ